MKTNRTYKTIRELAKVHPEMYDYYYKWRGTNEPELEKNLDDILLKYGYKLSCEDENFLGDYNDLKGYLNCNIVNC